LLQGLKARAIDLLLKLGVSMTGNHEIAFILGPLSEEISVPDSYTMEIAKEETTINATDASGLFHGLMSFVGLLGVAKISKVTLREITIYGKARFDYCGHPFDVACNVRLT